ncbi:uncharacterized protein Z520_07553 [Fonsecaea multimorphosa CBS 102226]|uniref:Uncharacterized protein n=1 Tax=Fonsecaea multimorphosa CBS 102226 TaxID=1442371 RepID=A0A0D2KJT6_9EURO|nr:uncharacterized protein Z520_07553 [Fonsecaea multimorphosa CBS 102226]KIX96833.1 hypothetical protein Z520_07553 [Fonsecaea multimorphosa CBS 102226]OAL22512.1 hypothetical protein AYO22_07070 [Fonsecaea multimorphosa]
MEGNTPHNQSGRNYLFVVKNAENIKGRDKDEAFAINSHVATHKEQEKRRRAKALKNQTLLDKSWSHATQRSGNSSTTTPDSVESAEAVPKGDDEGRRSQTPHILKWKVDSTSARRRPAEIQRLPPPANHSQRSPRYSRSAEAEYGTLLRADAVQSQESDRIRSVYPHPLTLLGNGGSDPFAAAALPINALNNHLIQFWELRFIRSLWPSGTSAAAAKTARSAWVEELQGAIASRAQLHAMFAGASIYVSRTMQQSPLKKKMLSAALEHKIACISLLKGLVNARALEINTIKGAYLAAMMHFFAGEFLESRTHFEAVRLMVAEAGGLGQLPWTLVLRIVVMDNMSAHLFLRPPKFAIWEWDPGPWNQQSFAHSRRVLDIARSQCRNVPLLKSEETFHKKLDAALRHYLASHREILFSRNIAHALAPNDGGGNDIVTPDAETADEIQSWAHARRYVVSAFCMVMYHDIVDRYSRYTNMSARRRLECELEKTLCLAVEYCQRIIFLFTWEQIAIYVPFHHLRAGLSRVLEYVSELGDGLEEHGQVLLYLFFVGAVAEELGDVFFADENRNRGLSELWFSRHMAALGEKIGVSGFEDSKRVFQLFLYDAPVLDPVLETLLAKRDIFLRDAPDSPL